jgi:hypothetical protein
MSCFVLTLALTRLQINLIALYNDFTLVLLRFKKIPDHTKLNSPRSKRKFFCRINEVREFRLASRE